MDLGYPSDLLRYDAVVEAARGRRLAEADAEGDDGSGSMESYDWREAQDLLSSGHCRMLLSRKWILSHEVSQAPRDLADVLGQASSIGRDALSFVMSCVRL